MNSINKISEDFGKFVDIHPYISSYRLSPMDDTNISNAVYPTMWHTLGNAVINDDVVNLTMSCDFLDIIQQDKTNLVSVLSNMLTVSQDFVAEFTNNYLKYTYELYFTSIENVMYEYNDCVGGWKITFTIELRQVRERME